MGRVFISYRRDDSKDIVGRIYDHLSHKIGKNKIFKDVDSIALGADFRKSIEESVNSCDVMLAIIGKQWLTLTNETGEKRINDPNDFVRVEIEAGIKRGIPVIPVLVYGAEIPAEKELPVNIRQLAFQNGLNVRADPDFSNDINKLVKSLNLRHGISKKTYSYSIILASVIMALLGSYYIFKNTIIFDSLLNMTNRVNHNNQPSEENTGKNILSREKPMEEKVKIEQLSEGKDKANVVNSEGKDKADVVNSEGKDKVNVDGIKGYFIDIRDAKKYKWVRLGNQVWMAENLAYKPQTGFYPKDDSFSLNSGGTLKALSADKYIQEYGGLYTWKSARSSCPEGWHLPTKNEWEELIKYHGGTSVAGRKLSGNIGAYSSWGDWNKLATNDFGFTAIPGGRMAISDNFLNYVAGFATYWSDTESSSTHAFAVSIQHFTNGAYIKGKSKTYYGLSVRCVKN